MAETDQDQKTEEPTEKKLSEAMDRGQFARSPELGVLLLLCALLGAFGFTAKAASRDIAEYSTGMFTRFASTPVHTDTVAVQLSEAMRTVGRAIAPILCAFVGAALLSGGLQSGFRMAPNAISFIGHQHQLQNLVDSIRNETPLTVDGHEARKTVAIVRALYDSAERGAPIKLT